MLLVGSKVRYLSNFSAAPRLDLTGLAQSGGKPTVGEWGRGMTRSLFLPLRPLRHTRGKNNDRLPNGLNALRAMDHEDQAECLFGDEL